MATNNDINQSNITTIFTSSGTWVKNPRTKFVTIIGWGSGQAAGSGRQAASGVSGGSPGAPGGCTFYVSEFSVFFNSSSTVTIGGTSSGGAPQTSVATNGNNGSLDNLSSVDYYSSTIGGSITQGGTSGTRAGSNGASSFSQYGSSTPTAGASGTTTTGTNATDIVSFEIVGKPGGGGSGANSGTPQQAGNGSGLRIGSAGSYIVAQAAGGISGGTIDGANGADASYPNGGVVSSGGGGGGGGGQSTAGGAVAGKGGNGGIPGSGGGGGGGSINGTDSGAGGDGARGEIWIIETF